MHRLQVIGNTSFINHMFVKGSFVLIKPEKVSQVKFTYISAVTITWKWKCFCDISINGLLNVENYSKYEISLTPEKKKKEIKNSHQLFLSEATEPFLILNVLLLTSGLIGLWWGT